MRRDTQSLILIFCFLLLVEPWVLQSQYQGAAITEYGDLNLTLADHDTTWGYYNTSGSIDTGTPTEVLVDNHSWSVDLAEDDPQDNERLSYYTVPFKAVNTVSTKWNYTAWDTTADEYITAIVIMFTDDSTKSGVLTVDIGFGGAGMDKLIGTFSIQEGVLTYIYMTTSIYAAIKANEPTIDSYQTRLYFYESDAYHLVDGASLTFEVHFMSGTNLIVFNQYLFIFGVLNLLIALGMTRSWNPVYGQSYRRGFYRAGRFGGYARRRWRSRRRFRYRPRFRRHRRY